MNSIRICMILMWVCTPIVTCFDCTENPSSSNPCECNPVIISVKDRTEQGAEIAKFNGTTNFTYTGTCAHSTLENNSVKLQLNLTGPCYEGKVPNCFIDCPVDRQVRVIVHLIPVDNYPPKFPKPLFNVTILEDLKLNGTVFDFNQEGHQPRDPDCNSDPNFAYSFLPNQDGDGHFALPGVGPLQLMKAVDYEGVKEYNVTVQVLTGNKTDTTVINVLIADVDDNDPEFVPTLGYVLKLEEETTAVSLSSTPSLLCRDMDTGINETVLYSFIDYDNSFEFLSINLTQGTFDVIRPLDRENKSSYVFELWCFQEDKHDKKAFTTLHIEVLDINDNPAIFEPELYDVTLVENAIGYVTTVIATDADIGDNAVILYEMIDSAQSSSLSVDENTGVVTIVSPADLDREATPNITVQIRAKDRYGNYSANTATVVITLLDINDNSPEFEPPFYLFNLNATHNTGTIGQVIAFDEDESDTPNSNVTYSFYDGTEIAIFRLHPLTGEIETTDTINSSADYDFIVLACDNPVYENDRRCNIANVKVVYGKNLTFSSTEVYIEVSENVPMETRIGKTLPITGEMYTTSSPDFDVDVTSSLLVTKTALDRETNDTYYLNINVWEYNTLKGNITVTINVTDVNDNAPVFSQNEYYLTIPHSARQNTSLEKLNATDNDTGQNAKLEFRFKSGYSDQFVINKESGEVFTSSQWKENVNYGHMLYQVLAEVEDQGVPKLNAVIPVYISAMNITVGNVVGIPTRLTQNLVMQNGSKTSIETKMSDILGFDLVQIAYMDNNRSLIYINATMNGTVTPSITIQRSVVENWSPIQNMFREFLEPRELSADDTSLSAAEIGLISVSVVIMLGTAAAIIIVCRQWKQHIKNHNLYNSLRRPSNMYDAQEVSLNFGDEMSSRLSTFNGRIPRTSPGETLEGSFGLGLVNAGFTDKDEDPPKTPIWSSCDTPRIPRWSTSDSIKDAMESLEELTTRLNSEDSISRITNLSRSRRSLKSNLSEPRSDKIPDGVRQSTPRTDDYENLKLTYHQTDGATDLNGNTRDDRNKDSSSYEGDSEGDITMADNDEQHIVSDTVPVISEDNTIEEEVTAF